MGTRSAHPRFRSHGVGVGGCCGAQPPNSKAQSPRRRASSSVSSRAHDCAAGTAAPVRADGRSWPSAPMPRRAAKAPGRSPSRSSAPPPCSPRASSRTGGRRAGTSSCHLFKRRCGGHDTRFGSPSKAHTSRWRSADHTHDLIALRVHEELMRQCLVLRTASSFPSPVDGSSERSRWVLTGTVAGGCWKWVLVRTFASFGRSDSVFIAKLGSYA